MIYESEAFLVGRCLCFPSLQLWTPAEWRSSHTRSAGVSEEGGWVGLTQSVASTPSEAEGYIWGDESAGETTEKGVYVSLSFI